MSRPGGLEIERADYEFVDARVLEPWEVMSCAVCDAGFAAQLAANKIKDAMIDSEISRMREQVRRMQEEASRMRWGDEIR